MISSVNSLSSSSISVLFGTSSAAATGDASTAEKVLNAVTYDGKSFKTYYDTYDVIQVNGDRVVIGVGATVTAAVNAANLRKA